MKHRTGTLIKRGNAYSVRVVVDKRIIVRTLKTPDGNPCNTLVEARRAQAIAVKVFTLTNRKEALESTIRKLSEVNKELETLETPKAKLADCWQAYLASGERPNSIHFGCMSFTPVTLPNG